jgi:protoporphyrinogen oxidase
MIELCRSLGLEADMQPIRQHQGVFLWEGGHQLEKIPTGMHLGLTGQPWMALVCSALSPRGKLRAALQGLLPDHAESHPETLGPYIRHRLEREANKELPSPFSPDVFACDPYELSLMNAFPQLAIFKQEHNTRNEGLAFATMEGGMQRLTDRLAERVPGDRHLGVHVQEIRTTDGGWEVVSGEGRIWQSHQLVLALPRLESARLMKGISPTIATGLSSPSAVTGACVYLGFEVDSLEIPWDAYGFVSGDVEARPLVACTWTRTGNRVLFRAYLRGSADFAIDSASTQKLIHTAWQTLEPMFGLPDPPLLSHVERYPEVFPQFHLGDIEQASHLEEQRTQIAGLYWTGPAFGAAGIPASVQHARGIAHSLVEQGLRS